ncbi:MULTISPECIES: DUF4337 domain-containing protein [Silvimonas]|uniref:DUF4337 domain-containing protein n=1 Tax=Silvimonas TaxID=300264 RepID=UPI0024B3A7FD|nr:MULTISPECIES: DUF4337 domain-containing protein [Silvimonas]MDR3429323.1 DUF4337 domain-containing protein [Silvimonas sp.]
MSEEKKDPWLNYLALTTVILAVCATLSTFKGGGYSTKGVISQAQASDQWAYYQAKGVKQYLYQIQRDNLVLQRDALPVDNKASAAYDAKIADYSSKVQQYDTEKHHIEDLARGLEAQRDDAQRHGKPFGIAVIFLQVAILISSIAGLFKRKVLWLSALPVGLVGVLYFVDGFFVLF